MHHLVALLAGCLLYPPADDPCHDARQAQYEFLRNHAQEVAWNDNGTVSSMNVTGIVVPGGIGNFQVGEPAPQLLKMIGPALLSAGTEELRVRRVNNDAPKADPTRPVRSVNLQQFIRGREVRGGFVTIAVNIETNELAWVTSNFLPDRGLDDVPRLTAAQAQAKAEVLMRKSPFAGAIFTFAAESAPRLAYAFEESGEFGVLGGALVWVFSARNEAVEWTEITVSAANGELVPRRDINAFWYMREVPTPLR